MKNIYTPFTFEYATHEVLKSVKPVGEINEISLSIAAEVIEHLAYKKEGYYRYEVSNKSVLQYADASSDSQRVGQWARCALYACIDHSAFNYGDTQTILEGFPSAKPMSSSHICLQYLDQMVFEGSAWDLIMDMLLVPQLPTQTTRVSRPLLRWATNVRNHGFVEIPSASVSEKWQHVWESLASRSQEVERVFSNPKKFKKPKEQDFRTALCDIMPHLFVNEQIALEMAASSVWQTWIKHISSHSPADLKKLASAIVGAPLDMATKKQLGGHLKALIGSETLTDMLKNFPSQTIIQGLWKSYFAFAEGCGISAENSIEIQKNNFKAALTNNVNSTLVMDRYLPLFKNTPGFEYTLEEMPFALWKKSKLVKSNTVGKSWAILQKHNLIPPTLSWDMVEDELKHLSHYQDEDEAQQKLRSLVQNHRLRQELVNTVASEVHAPTRRRM